MDYTWEPLLANFRQQLDYLLSYGHLHRLVLSIVILAAFWLLRKRFADYTVYLLAKMTSNERVDTQSYLSTACRRPAMNIMAMLGLYFAAKNYLPLGYEPLLNRILSSFIVVFLTQGLHGLIKIYGDNTAELERLLGASVDKILIPFFSKVIRFLIVALAFVVVASNWGYDVNGFIAGLGLGGLAFALAAKDMLANIFSGIVIITDKPFGIGDWIKTPDVEGTIEDINFRSTKIRTFEQALVTVPNASLINAPIVNFTKRKLRRITFNLNVSYDTPSQALQQCVSRIQTMLVDHPAIDNKMIFVKFDTFGDNSLTIFLYFFTTTIVWEEYLNIKQEVNFLIMQILEEEGVEIAIPRTRNYFSSPLEVIRSGDEKTAQPEKTEEA